MMKLSRLLATRNSIVRQAYLANLAYSYQTLKRLADRVDVAGLRGLVRLCQADVDASCYWASLTALEGNQSVIEEHFDDEDIMDMADAIAFAIEGDFSEIEFNIEDLERRYVAPLRLSLDKAGIAIDLRSKITGCSE